MMTFWERLVSFNTRMNGLPRKFLLIITVLAAFFICMTLLPLVMPFAIAALIAAMMNPLVKLLSRGMEKFRFKNAVSTLIAMVVVYGLVGFLSYQLIHRIVIELVSLARAMPDIVRNISNEANEFIALIRENYQEYLPDNIDTLIKSAVDELTKSLTSFAGTITKSVAGGAISAAFSLPEATLTVVLTIMGTFYISYDRQRIFAFFKRVFPAPVVSGTVSLKNNILASVFGQVKSQVLVSCLITLTVTLGLLIMQRPYGLVMGLVIGIADALPVIGAGLFLITWSVISFISGDVGIGIGLMVLYLLTILVRNVSEPRIVGKNLGLYPLATMMSLYAGFKLLGVIGMLAGPILLNVLKVVLAADAGLLTPPDKPEGPSFLFKGKLKVVQRKIQKSKE